MKVELIDYTKDALEKLLFTKQTRLSMSGGLFEEIKKWPEEKKLRELEYMRNTIQSSWEMVDYTFALQDVDRAFTHQLVRTRNGAYAQQSQRTVSMEGFDYTIPEAIEGEGLEIYNSIMESINSGYQKMRQIGINPQDARGVLPTNICTNIVAKFSLRALSDMAKVRLCTRTQGLYQQVFREMRNKVIEVHPWTEDFINVHCVAVGTCCFPNYKECPIKPSVFNPDTGYGWDGDVSARPSTRKEIKQIWQQTKFEAIPTQAKEMKDGGGS